MLAGALFSFSPPLHTSPPRLFTGWEEDINAARFQRFSTGKEPVAGFIRLSQPVDPVQHPEQKEEQNVD